MKQDWIADDFRHALMHLNQEEWAILEIRFGLSDGRIKSYQQLTNEWPDKSAKQCQQATVTAIGKLQPAKEVSAADIKPRLIRLRHIVEQECLYRHSEPCVIATDNTKLFFNEVFNVNLQ